MEAQEFAAEIARLKETFGERFYGKERTQLIFQAVRQMPHERFRSIVTRFIGDRATAPNVKDFIEAVKECDWVPSNALPKPKRECRTCGSTGYVHAEVDVPGAPGIKARVLKRCTACNQAPEYIEGPPNIAGEREKVKVC